MERLETIAAQHRRRHNSVVLQAGPNGSVRTQNFVGVIRLGGDAIEILPKIDTKEMAVRRNLVTMIARAYGLDLRVGEMALMNNPSDTLLEVFIRFFCRQLWHELHRGIAHRYEPRSENLVVLRGRVDFPRQLRSNLCRPDRLECDYDEFTEDNPLNQVLKATVRQLGRVTLSLHNAQDLSALIACFDAVADVPLAALPWHRLHDDRLTNRFRPLVTLCRMFVAGRGPDVVSGAGDGFSLLFDMNELFEKYVGREVKRAFQGADMEIRLDTASRHLATDSHGRPAFELRPDIVAVRNGSFVWIADTKWKRLKKADVSEGPSTADVYQMYAYLNRYEAPRVVLLYPHDYALLGPWTSTRASYRFQERSRGQRSELAISTVDLTDLSTVPDQLRAILDGEVRNSCDAVDSCVLAC
jgi:5-methylcytosine-specific restriction enzyme subunit McrC